MNNPDNAQVPFTAPQHGVTVVAKPRKLNMYSITEDELDSLYTAGNYKSLDVALFSLSLGVFVTLIVTLSTVELLNPAILAMFTSGTLVSALLTVFFAVRAIIAWFSAKRCLERIKRSEAT